MTDKMIVSDPDEVRKKDTDGRGRLFLGKRFRNKKVRYAVKVLGDADAVTDEDEDDGDE